MTSYDILKDIVRAGADLTITHPIDYDFLRELACIAKQSESRLTVSTAMSHDLIRELLALAAKHITFVDTQ